MLFKSKNVEIKMTPVIVLLVVIAIVIFVLVRKLFQCADLEEKLKTSNEMFIDRFTWDLHDVYPVYMRKYIEFYGLTSMTYGLYQWYNSCVQHQSEFDSIKNTLFATQIAEWLEESASDPQLRSILELLASKLKE